MFKNVASQKLVVYAYDTSADTPKTGDAANITIQISKDGGACAASNDTNPTELDSADAKGIYIFDLLQAESNCDLFIGSPVSSTGNIVIEPVIVYTTDIVTDVGTALATYDAPTKAELDSGLAGLNDLSSGDVETAVGTAIATYDPPTKAELDSGLSGLNDPTAAEIITALKESTGYTAGGTYTFAAAIKILLAVMAGKFQDKDGEAGTYEILDPDDGETVILEIIPLSTTPQRSTTIS